MRKYIIGFIVGAMVMTAGTALADVDIRDLIGETIQGQFDVQVDGEYIEYPAIVVDGTSFLPVRDFAQTVGYAVYFDTEGGIMLERDMNSLNLESEGEQIQEMNKRIEKQDRKDEISKIENNIQRAQDQIDRYEERQQHNIEERGFRSEAVDDEIAKLKAEIKQLQGEKSEKESILQALEQQT